MKNIKILLLILVSSLAFGACTSQKTPNQSPTQQNSTNTVDSSNTPTPSAQTPTMDEVATHNSKESCWFVIDDSVYDVTDFISKHPGGIVIMQGCGKDASKLFHAVGKHQSKANSILETLKIGELKK